MKTLISTLLLLWGTHNTVAQAGQQAPQERREHNKQPARPDQSGAANVAKPKGFTGTDAVRESSTGGNPQGDNTAGVQQPKDSLSSGDTRTDPPGKKANYGGTPKNNNTGTKGRDTLRTNEGYRRQNRG